VKSLLRKLLPDTILNGYREWKKSRTRQQLSKQAKSGQIITQQILVEQLRNMGITTGDILMVHSAMSKIGFLQDGPKTFVDALFEVIGETGTLCMPSSPVKDLQLRHMQQNPVFDVRHTPSAMGAISEYFRLLPGTVRSLHPTEPVCAQGFLADEITKDHFGQVTPYNALSPWKKLMDANGKILYVGVTLINSGTHLHTLEDAVDFKYPVYYPEIITAQLIDMHGTERTLQTRVHNPEYSAKRRCDELIPIFENEGVLQKFTLGKAPCLLVDANKMFEVMVKLYHERGVTMYTPLGS